MDQTGKPWHRLTDKEPCPLALAVFEDDGGPCPPCTPTDPDPADMIPEGDEPELPLA